MGPFKSKRHPRKEALLRALTFPWETMVGHMAALPSLGGRRAEGPVEAGGEEGGAGSP